MAPTWQQGLSADDLAPVRDLLDAATAADRVAPLSGHILALLDTGTDHYLLHRRGDRPVALAVAHHADPVELVVHPDMRRTGIGSALLSAAVERAGSVWAHGDLAPARELARVRGLTRTRLLLQMRRTGPHPSPPAALPDGLRLRTFVPGQDEDAFLQVNARAFAWHPEQGRLDATGLQEEMAQEWFDPAGFFLAVDEHDAVVGFHWTKVHPVDSTPGDAPAGPIGEIYVLGVDPEAGIRGLGGPLTAAGLDHLAGRGLGTVMLYVEGDNDRALALYRRYGFDTYLSDAVYAPGTPTADA